MFRLPAVLAVCFVFLATEARAAASAYLVHATHKGKAISPIGANTLSDAQAWANYLRSVGFTNVRIVPGKAALYTAQLKEYEQWWNSRTRRYEGRWRDAGTAPHRDRAGVQSYINGWLSGGRKGYRWAGPIYQVQ